MKHQVLFCLSLISFLSYSMDRSAIIAGRYLTWEVSRLDWHQQPRAELASINHSYAMIANIPMSKKDQNECLAIMKQAEQDNKSFEGLVEWSKSHYDSGKMRKIHRS